MPARKTRKPQRKITIPYVSGRPPTGSKPDATFLPNEEHLVRMLAARGATDKEMEQLCGVPAGTLAKWRAHYPSLNDALEKGRSKVDGDVLFALYKNATGFDYEEEQVAGKDAIVRTVKRKALPETAAQKAWLFNRKRDEWGDRLSIAGDRDKPIALEHSARKELIDAILGLVEPKPDNEVIRNDDSERQSS
jgi:hypothetical protein